MYHRGQQRLHGEVLMGMLMRENATSIRASFFALAVFAIVVSFLALTSCNAAPPSDQAMLEGVEAAYGRTFTQLPTERYTNTTERHGKTHKDDVVIWRFQDEGGVEFSVRYTPTFKNGTQLISDYREQWIAVNWDELVARAGAYDGVTATHVDMSDTPVGKALQDADEIVESLDGVDPLIKDYYKRYDDLYSLEYPNEYTFYGLEIAVSECSGAEDAVGYLASLAQSGIPSIQEPPGKDVWTIGGCKLYDGGSFDIRVVRTGCPHPLLELDAPAYQCADDPLSAYYHYVPYGNAHVIASPASAWQRYETITRELVLSDLQGAYLSTVRKDLFEEDLSSDLTRRTEFYITRTTINGHEGASGQGFALGALNDVLTWYRWDERSDPATPPIPAQDILAVLERCNACDDYVIPTAQLFGYPESDLLNTSFLRELVGRSGGTFSYSGDTFSWTIDGSGFVVKYESVPCDEGRWKGVRALLSATENGVPIELEQPFILDMHEGFFGYESYLSARDIERLFHVKIIPYQPNATMDITTNDR